MIPRGLCEADPRFDAHDFGYCTNSEDAIIRDALLAGRGEEGIFLQLAATGFVALAVLLVQKLNWLK